MWQRVVQDGLEQIGECGERQRRLDLDRSRDERPEAARAG